MHISNCFQHRSLVSHNIFSSRVSSPKLGHGVTVGDFDNNQYSYVTCLNA